MATEMMSQINRMWGWIVLRGIVAVVFGIMAFAWPSLTLTALLLVWAAYALADGVFALIAAFRMAGKPMWPLAIIGVLGIAAGVVTFLWPQMTALVLLAFIAGWALATGIFQIATAIRFRKFISNEWMLGLSGLLSIVFGAVLLWRPGAGALAVVSVIGWFAILYGILLVMFGFRIRGLVNRMIPKPA